MGDLGSHNCRAAGARPLETHNAFAGTASSRGRAGDQSISQWLALAVAAVFSKQVQI